MAHPMAENPTTRADSSHPPPEYAALGRDELERRIGDCKGRLGRRLCILGHHYQRDEIVQFADFTGDSLKLSRLAAGQADAEFIVFCGVHFMAETADMLSGEGQAVCLPNPRAGCAMAEMADADAVQAAGEEIVAMTDAPLVPVAYVNSTAAVKAVVARAGGACCTSSNVRNVFDWALRRERDGGAGGRKILAVPDEHLARNTAVAMGHTLDDCVVYDPRLPNGGLTDADVDRATFILWRGHCYVHQLFTPGHVVGARRRHDGIRVVVHPECTHEVVQLSDAAGSTEQIIRAVEAGGPGDRWAVGTESNLVNRLAKRHPDRFVRVLSDVAALCAQMARIDLPHLLWVLEGLTRGQIVNRVSVPPETAADARLAVRRMIDIQPVSGVTPTAPQD